MYGKKGHNNSEAAETHASWLAGTEVLTAAAAHGASFHP